MFMNLQKRHLVLDSLIFFSLSFICRANFIAKTVENIEKKLFVFFFYVDVAWTLIFAVVAELFDLSASTISLVPLQLQSLLIVAALFN